jgi:hypothetical protein
MRISLNNAISSVEAFWATVEYISHEIKKLMLLLLAGVSDVPNISIQCEIVLLLLIFSLLLPISQERSSISISCKNFTTKTIISIVFISFT